MSVFEAAMLLCFGAAWPFSIVKSYKSRSTGGKSPVFLIVVLAGYFSGILNKILYARDWVVLLYGLNAVMVGIDLCLWFRNRSLEKSE
jgi:hypothetical protein